VLLFLFASIILGRNEAYSRIIPTENPMPDRLFVPAELLNIRTPDKLPSTNHDIEMPRLPDFFEAEDNQNEIVIADKTPQFIWPIFGVITSHFGFRYNGIYSGFHEGMDIAAPTGTPIMAAACGVVKRADSVMRGYGNLVIVYHGNGLETRYAHCSAFAVNVGDTVSTGQIIAYVGSSGRATSSHLHFEIVINGIAQNPMYFLGDYRSALSALISNFRLRNINQQQLQN